MVGVIVVLLSTVHASRVLVPGAHAVLLATALAHQLLLFVQLNVLYFVVYLAQYAGGEATNTVQSVRWQLFGHLDEIIDLDLVCFAQSRCGMFNLLVAHRGVPGHVGNVGLVQETFALDIVIPRGQSQYGKRANKSIT